MPRMCCCELNWFEQTHRLHPLWDDRSVRAFQMSQQVVLDLVSLGRAPPFPRVDSCRVPLRHGEFDGLGIELTAGYVVRAFAALTGGSGPFGARRTARAAASSTSFRRHRRHSHAAKAAASATASATDLDAVPQRPCFHGTTYLRRAHRFLLRPRLRVVVVLATARADARSGAVRRRAPGCVRAQGALVAVPSVSDVGRRTGNGTGAGSASGVGCCDLVQIFT